MEQNSEVDDPVVRFYRRLREALIYAKRNPELRTHRSVTIVQTALSDLASLILERNPPSDLSDIRSLDTEFRDAGILFMIDKHDPSLGATLSEFADRLYEVGGWERVLSDPEIRTIADLINKLSDVEPWHA